MGWVRDWVRFPERARRFVLPRHKAIHTDVLKHLDSESPEALEAVLKAIIKETRPSLAHCQIVAMQMNYEYARWEVLITDESLPVVESGVIECETL
jgi:hypothetical protein